MCNQQTKAEPEISKRCTLTVSVDGRGDCDLPYGYAACGDPVERLFNWYGHKAAYCERHRIQIETMMQTIKVTLQSDGIMP